jgi:hypothetical protein
MDDDDSSKAIPSLKADVLPLIDDDTLRSCVDIRCDHHDQTLTDIDALVAAGDVEGLARLSRETSHKLRDSLIYGDYMTNKLKKRNKGNRAQASRSDCLIWLAGEVNAKLLASGASYKERVAAIQDRTGKSESWMDKHKIFKK